MARTIFSIMALLGMLSFAQGEAALRWDSKRQELHPSSSQKAVLADFGFTNIGSQPVVIDSVKPSCGCTTAALDKKTYQPGEKGRIRAIFTIGGRKGTQVKEIIVVVRGASEPTVLTMITHIPEAMRINPPFVSWRTGEAPQPKTILFSLSEGEGMRLASVSSSDPRMEAVLETLRDGSEYKITVRPENTDQQTMAVLNIQAVSNSNEAKVFQAYAQVKESKQ